MTELEAQRDRIRAIEARIADMQQRLNAAIFQKEQARQAIVKGTATTEQVASVAAWDMAITELHDLLIEKNDYVEPQGIFAELKNARDILRRLEDRRAALAKEIENIEEQQTAGLGDKAAAALTGLQAAMPFVWAIGEGDTLNGRAMGGIRARALRVKQDIDNLPNLHAQLDRMGE